MSRQRFIFAPDIHAPFHDKACVAILLEHVKHSKPHKVVLGGDILDCYTISRFDRKIKNGPAHLRDEFEVANEEVIRPIWETTMKANSKAEIVWISGNHEDRFCNRLLPGLAATGMAAIYDLLPSIEEYFDLKGRGIRWIPSTAGNGHYALTPLLECMHGSALGDNPAKAQYLRWGGSLLMGHAHRQSSYMVTFGNGQKHVSMCSGTLSQPPTYQDVHQHALGFIAGWIDTEDGTFGAWHETIVKKGGRYDLYSPIGHIRAVVGRNGKIAVSRAELT